MQVKNRRFLIKFRATYLCSITLFMAIPGYFKMQDKSRNPAGAIYCIPTEQNSFSVVIHT